MFIVRLCALLQTTGFASADFYTKLTAWGTVITGVATLLLVLTGIGAMLFAHIQIQSERSYRQVENLEREIAKFKTGTCLTARSLLAKYRISSRCAEAVDDVNVPRSAYDLLNFFEHVGLLARKGHVELRAVWHSLGWWILVLGADLEPLVRQQRALNKSVLQDFQWLVEQIRQIEMKEEGKELKLDASGLCVFYKDEVMD